MKTPEELAKEWAIDWHKDCDYPEAILKQTHAATMTTFLAGYKAGVTRGIIDTEKRILNEYFDQYGAEEHATFAVAVNAYELNDDDENT